MRPENPPDGWSTPTHDSTSQADLDDYSILRITCTNCDKSIEMNDEVIREIILNEAAKVLSTGLSNGT